jgi:RNA-directed DNA polymerase
MRAKLQSLKRELRRRMHAPIPVQGKWLGQVVRGYFAYHSVPTNTRRLSAFRDHVKVIWRRVLRRHSQKDRTPRDRMRQLADAFLPTPRILHPWPEARFLVNHPRWEPSA